MHPKSTRQLRIATLNAHVASLSSPLPTTLTQPWPSNLLIGDCGPRSSSRQSPPPTFNRNQTIKANSKNSGLTVGIGGPAFTAWVSPSEEEIRAKYNPELRQRSIEGKAAREAEFDEFVTRLKEYSKSDKPSTYYVFRI